MAASQEQQQKTSLREALALDQIALSDTFSGLSIRTFWGRLFGGQIIAQSVIAASRTVPDDRPMHSIHGYFILAGKLDLPLLFRVIRVRDGGSFATRIVNVLQENKIIFTMTASFHRPEPGPEFQIPVKELRAILRYQLQNRDFGEHSDLRPSGVPTPEDLIESGDSTVFLDMSGNIERVSVGSGDRWQMWWGRYGGPGAEKLDPEDWRLHQALVTYMSDFGMVETAKQPHLNKTEFSLSMSLDHALHFYHKIDAAEWLLFHIETSVSSGARGLARASVFTKSGLMVASIVQEGLMRVPRKSTAKL